MKIKSIIYHQRSLTLPVSIITALIILIFLAALDLPHSISTQAASGYDSITGITTSLTPPKVYMPFVQKDTPVQNPFGLESNYAFVPGSNALYYTTGAHVNYARLNGRISWFDLQPNEGDPINWSLLVGFENELRALKAANITPVIVVDDYPRWATDNTARLDDLPTSCGPLLPERYDDFAAFMQALVARYSAPEFDAHIWEMGNEPDVDPDTVAIDSDYGCWGDADDPFYNGRAYGQMLMTVTPAVRAIDPQAQVWIGGLLLDRPYSEDGNIGQPEDFFRGILESGAAPYFDMVTYHAYIHYSSTRIDMDIFYGTSWYEWGGMLRGKGSYLRWIMAEYGVDKPVFITETSQLCGWCPADYLPGLFDMQANMPARSFPRAMAADISGFIWYTLEDNYWQYSSLLDPNMMPKPVYTAYQTFNAMVAYAEFIGFVGYDYGIEAYTFHKGAARIDIIFAVEDVTYTINIPQTDYIAAYDRFGALITPTLADSNYTLTVQYEPIYLVRTR
jgi:hypothetical protein